MLLPIKAICDHRTRKDGTDAIAIQYCYSPERRTVLPLRFLKYLAIPFMKIKMAKLPLNWKEWPQQKEARDFGTKLLNENKYLVIKFPSAIIPAEFIYVINPLHTRIKEIKIIEVGDCLYDQRLKN